MVELILMTILNKISMLICTLRHSWLALRILINLGGLLKKMVTFDCFWLFTYKVQYNYIQRGITPTKRRCAKGDFHDN